MELVMDSPSTSPYNDINEKVLEWFRSVPKFQRNIPILQNELRTVILPAAIENHTLNVEVDDSGAITNPLSIECIRNKLIQWLFIWDKVFLQDNRFISKRANCYSNTTKQFNAVNNQRVDFIWRNVNDESDYASAEEKPGRKGVRSDVRKAKSRYAIEMMTFEAEDDTLYESQSSDGSETNNEMYMDKELEEKILCDLKNIKLDEDIVTSDDWKILSCTKHRTKEKELRNPYMPTL
ncbi:hypothetical protein HPULCUR_008053 [Helicostylum pulchrum]|uniref:Uncharacterized protein n=1 Tax=Helicostylum pulchrum TaxID=562976 RepID=A0ABP9Y7N8_9FUNG